MPKFKFKYELPYAVTEGEIEAKDKAEAKKLILQDIDKKEAKHIKLEIK